MAYRIKDIDSKKGFTIGRVKSFPPAERVASLVDGDKKIELIPLTTPFEEMEFPRGVFTRGFEEFHYLDMVLARQAGAYLMKELAESNSISSISAKINPHQFLFDQMKEPDWFARAAEEYPEHTLRDALQGSNDFQSTIESVTGMSLQNAAEIQAYEGSMKNALQGYRDQEKLAKQAQSAAGLASQNAQFKPTDEPLPRVIDDSMRHVFVETRRAQEEQKKRDEHQAKQAENSDALLKLHTEQIEENRRQQEKQLEENIRQQAEQRRDSRFTKIMAVAALIVSIISAVIPAL